MSFLKQVLNAQIVVTLLGMVIPSFFLANKIIGEAIWLQVFLGVYTLFVGGGFLKEGWAAFLNKETK